MAKIFIILCVTFIFASCHNYENKDKYEVEVGETIEIYYSTNSCCYYCLVNSMDLKHTELVEQKTVDPGPKGCAGCNFTGAFVIKATSAGTDTIQLKNVQANMTCDSMPGEPQKFVVQVR